MSLLDEPVHPSSWPCRDAERRSAMEPPPPPRNRPGVAFLRHVATAQHYNLRSAVAFLPHLSQGKRRANRAPDGANNYCFLSTVALALVNEICYTKCTGNTARNPRGFK